MLERLMKILETLVVREDLGAIIFAFCFGLAMVAVAIGCAIHG